MVKFVRQEMEEIRLLVVVEAPELLLLDILRNEKPVYWTEEGGIVWTGKEPVGEGERR